MPRLKYSGSSGLTRAHDFRNKPFVLVLGALVGRSRVPPLPSLVPTLRVGMHTDRRPEE